MNFECLQLSIARMLRLIKRFLCVYMSLQTEQSRCTLGKCKHRRHQQRTFCLILETNVNDVNTVFVFILRTTISICRLLTRLSSSASKLYLNHLTGFKKERDAWQVDRQNREVIKYGVALKRGPGHACDILCLLRSI